MGLTLETRPSSPASASGHLPPMFSCLRLWRFEFFPSQRTWLVLWFIGIWSPNKTSLQSETELFVFGRGIHKHRKYKCFTAKNTLCNDWAAVIFINFNPLYHFRMNSIMFFRKTDWLVEEVPILSTDCSTDLSSHVCPSNTSHVLDWFPVWFSKQRLQFIKCGLVLSCKMVGNCHLSIGVDCHYWTKLAGLRHSRSHVWLKFWFFKHWLTFAKGGLAPSCKTTYDNYPSLKFFVIQTRDRHTYYSLTL